MFLRLKCQSGNKSTGHLAWSVSWLAMQAKENRENVPRWYKRI